jgi:hypothetical protein
MWHPLCHSIWWGTLSSPGSNPCHAGSDPARQANTRAQSDLQCWAAVYPFAATCMKHRLQLLRLLLLLLALLHMCSSSCVDVALHAGTAQQ